MRGAIYNLTYRLINSLQSSWYLVLLLLKRDNKALMEYAQRPNNWFNYQAFYKKIASNPRLKIFAEVGVWKGHSISFLANQLRNRRGVKIYAIDLFEKVKKYKGTQYESDAKQISKIYNKNLEDTKTRYMILDVRDFSDKAAQKFNDGYFDFVFIDADHSYESVIRDINAWVPKLKWGGILSGHDFNNRNAGVRRAVLETFSPQRSPH